MVDITTHLNQVNTKPQARGNIEFHLIEKVVSFLHSPSLSQYQKKTNDVIDKELFETEILKMNGSFLMRFQDFWKVRETLSFITDPLNVKVNELRFYLFEIEIAAFEMQLLDMDSTDLYVLLLKL